MKEKSDRTLGPEEKKDTFWKRLRKKFRRTPKEIAETKPQKDGAQEGNSEVLSRAATNKEYENEMGKETKVNAVSTLKGASFAVVTSQDPQTFSPIPQNRTKTG